MSAVFEMAPIPIVMFVGMVLFVTGILAVSGGNNMHRIGLSTPRRGMIAMIVGIILFTIGITNLT